AENQVGKDKEDTHHGRSGGSEGLSRWARRSVGGWSPDRPPLVTEGLPWKETFGRPKGHGQETVPQPGRGGLMRWAEQGGASPFVVRNHGADVNRRAITYSCGCRGRHARASSPR